MPHHHTPTILLKLLVLLLLTACRSTAPDFDYRALAQAGLTLGIDIDMHDNHKLYLNAAQWVGIPYCPGGNSRHGIDCSGLTSNIYNKVYKKQLARTADTQLNQNCRRVSKHQLQEGDLVFFHDRHSRRKASHVGIYLKNNKFIHASTSRGVIVSSLDETYYKRFWLAGGRVK